MATETAPTKVRAPVIRLVEDGETFSQRLVKRQMPAWLVSVGFHAVLLALFIALNSSVSSGGSGKNGNNGSGEIQELKTVVEEKEETQNFENPDIGNDVNLPTNYDIARIEDVSIAGPLKPDEAVGNNQGDLAPMTLPPPPGLGESNAGQGGGIDAAINGLGPLGAPGGLNGPPLQPGMGFRGRSGATRERMLTQGGGNGASEACVARGLIWLSKQQRPDGSWSFETPNGRERTVAATSVALLPFLAAGYTHKSAPKGTTNPNNKEQKGSKYPQQIEKGLKYLLSKQGRDGKFQGQGDMYDHALATMALCEAYGMTNDPRLRGPAQLAVEYIVRAQSTGGGWRYSPGQTGDTSVTGWQIQALMSAHLAGLKVPREVLSRAILFLDSVAGGNPVGSQYGYTSRGGSPAMTAVGLLCRQYLGWGIRNPALVAGVEYLKQTPPRDIRKADDNRPMDIYYFYYATQVIHFYGGADWYEFWNPRMRDWLLNTQVSGTSPQAGSWNPDSTHTATVGGRLLQTALSLLTLEVYYRHLPLYKREAVARQDLEGS
jgi:hypothetical protein